MIADAQATAAMATIAQQTMARREGGGDPYGAPVVELVDSVVDAATGTTRVRFVFDFMVRHGVQSGSDTYYHHVFAASATLGAGAVTAQHVVPCHAVYVSEFAVEWAPEERRYDPAQLRRSAAAECRRQGWNAV